MDCETGFGRCQPKVIKMLMIAHPLIEHLGVAMAASFFIAPLRAGINDCGARVVLGVQQAVFYTTFEHLGPAVEHLRPGPRHICRAGQRTAGSYVTSQGGPGVVRGTVHALGARGKGGARGWRFLAGFGTAVRELLELGFEYSAQPTSYERRAAFMAASLERWISLDTPELARFGHVANLCYVPGRKRHHEDLNRLSIDGGDGIACVLARSVQGWRLHASSIPLGIRHHGPPGSDLEDTSVG